MASQGDNLANIIQSSKILFADKKRSLSLLHTIDLLESEKSDSRAYRMALNDFIGNITYKNDKVKIEGKDFNEGFYNILDNFKRV